MVSLKRRRDGGDEEDEDEDEDEPLLGRQILPVANLPEDFNEEPNDGLEYLFTVRRDARQLPHVTRVPNPYEIPDPPQPIAQEINNTSHPALPSAEWLDLFETRFKNFRRNLKQPTIHVETPFQTGKQRLMPDKKERELWWHFLAGKRQPEWDLPKNQKSKRMHQGMRSWDDEMLDEGSYVVFQEGYLNDENGVEQSPEPKTLHSPKPKPTEPLQQSSLTFTCREPSTALIKTIDERMALHLLMYFTYWINKHLEHPNPPSSLLMETHARWMFMLLARIDDYISADDMSLLRNLARSCLALLKANIQELTTPVPMPDDNSGQDQDSPMTERSCWVIFSTIVRIWKQNDLWMDAEDMLKHLKV